MVGGPGRVPWEEGLGSWGVVGELLYTCCGMFELKDYWLALELDGVGGEECCAVLKSVEGRVLKGLGASWLGGVQYL